MAAGKRILILATSAGAGHLMAAGALEHAFRQQAPEAVVEVRDVLALASRWFRRAYAGGYLALVQRAPAAFGWLYELMDRPGGRWRDALRAGGQAGQQRRVARYLRQCRPDLIVNTHFLPAEFTTALRRRGQLDCPQVIVTTDYQTHRLWVQEPTDRYYVATPEGGAYLRTWGVPAERIALTGIPVRPGFDRTLAPEEARQRCGLAPSRPVVLLLCGGFGVGPVVELLAELLAMPGDAQVAVVAGRNEALRRRLAGLAVRGPRPATVIGFTDRVHEWMRAADVVVSKPGGLTVSEALACGLPLVVVNPIPGQEARNSDYVLEHGAAIKVGSPRLLGWRVSRLLADAERLRALRRAAAGLGRPGAAAAIAADALRLIGAGAGPDGGRAGPG